MLLALKKKKKKEFLKNLSFWEEFKQVLELEPDTNGLWNENANIIT